MNFWYKKEKIQLKSQNNLNKGIMKNISNICNTYDCIKHISSDSNSEEHLILDPLYGWRLGKTSDTHLVKD